MNKQILFIILVFFTAIYYGKEKNKVLYTKATKIQNIKNENYDIFYEVFSVIDETNHTDIHIRYPQLKANISSDKSKKINELIKKQAIYNFYSDDFKDGISMDIKSEIKYFSSNLISIRYYGNSYEWGSNYVYDINYSTNIDLKKIKLLNIDDIFNNNLKKILSRENFKFEGPYKAESGEEIEENSHEYNYIHGDSLIYSKIFSDYYNNFSNNTFYFSKDKFFIIINIPFDATQILELSTKYDILKKTIRSNSVIWNEFYK